MTQLHHQNHATWGVQISCGFHPEISQEGDFRGHQEAARRRVPRIGATPREQDRGRASDARPVGRDEETIRAYIKNQELQDREMDQLALIPESHPKSSKVR